MANMKQLIGELVAANRILANENVVDAYGHVSVRHPEDPGKFLLSRSRSPELVEPDDIMTFTLDGKPADGRSDPAYFERFIHCGATSGCRMSMLWSIRTQGLSFPSPSARCA